MATPDEAFPDLENAYQIARPAAQSAPLVVASPHSGQVYPQALHDASALPPETLRRSEDSFVDELFAASPRLGAPLLSARFARIWCDPNREAWELDPAMFSDTLPGWVNSSSARVQSGLGTIARVVATGETVYRRKLRFAEAEDRVHRCWQPYHNALAALIAETRQRFGQCLLLDCHSMPALGSGRDRPDFVLGDAHGESCGGAVIRHVELFLANAGYHVRRNRPYAGGYITRHYGQPAQGVHAIQIEIARPLYMNERQYQKTPRFSALQADLSAMVASIAGAFPKLV